MLVSLGYGDVSYLGKSLKEGHAMLLETFTEWYETYDEVHRERAEQCSSEGKTALSLAF